MEAWGGLGKITQIGKYICWLRPCDTADTKEHSKDWSGLTDLGHDRITVDSLAASKVDHGTSSSRLAGMSHSVHGEQAAQGLPFVSQADCESSENGRCQARVGPPNATSAVRGQDGWKGSSDEASEALVARIRRDDDMRWRSVQCTTERPRRR